MCNCTTPKTGLASDSIAADSALADLAGIGHLLTDLSKRHEDETDMHPLTLYFLAASILRLVRVVEDYVFPGVPRPSQRGPTP